MTTYETLFFLTCAPFGILFELAVFASLILWGNERVAIFIVRLVTPVLVPPLKLLTRIIERITPR